MDINQLHQALDKLMISSQEDKVQKSCTPPQHQMRRQMNNFNPENYYPNPNNTSNKNISYYATTVNPNSLNSDEYYNDEYYNGGRNYNSNNLSPPYSNDCYYTRGSNCSSSQSSVENFRDKKVRNFEQLKIKTDSKTHSRTHSYGSSDTGSPKYRSRDRRGSQDSTTTPLSSYSQSSASLSELWTASLKSDVNSVILQSLSLDLASGYLNRITSSAGFIKSTKRFYFVLDTEGLYYFKSNDPYTTAKGLIKFDSKTKIKDIKENSSAKDKSSKLIELEVFKDNKYHQVVLQAEDPEDRDMWHRAIKKMIVRQKYVNEALPPIPHSQPIQVSPSSGMHSRSSSQSQLPRNFSPNQTLSYTQQLRFNQQKLYQSGGSLPLSKKSSIQSINEVAAAGPNMYNLQNLQNRRRPSFDVQMLHHHSSHSRTSSLTSLNDLSSAKQRFSYVSNVSLNRQP